MGRFDHLVEKYKDKSYEELKDLSTILEDKWENEKRSMTMRNIQTMKMNLSILSESGFTFTS